MGINPKKSAYAWLNTLHQYTPCVNNINFELLDSTKPYRYVGVWITLSLDWSEQKSVLEQLAHNVMSKITNKYYISGALLARITNATIMAIIGYRMQVIWFDKIWLDKFMNIIVRYLNKACRLSSDVSVWAWINLRGLANPQALNLQRQMKSLDRNLQRPGPNSAKDAILCCITHTKSLTAD